MGTWRGYSERKIAASSVSMEKSQQQRMGLEMLLNQSLLWAQRLHIGEGHWLPKGWKSRAVLISSVPAIKTPKQKT